LLKTRPTTINWTTTASTNVGNATGRSRSV
jgi:hypothetical protein